MVHIRWERYPHVAQEPHVRDWLGPGLAARTVAAYGRGADAYLPFCHRAAIGVLTATKADVAAYIDEMAQRPNPKGPAIRYL